MTAFRLLLVSLAIAVLFLAEEVRADILVMKDGSGRIYITNQGNRPGGYEIVHRLRETPRARLRRPPAEVVARYERMIADTARRFQVEPALVKAVVRAESNFDERAVSPKGAMGLMQLMPGTARMHSVNDPFDPIDNVQGGVRHLRYLYDRYAGNLDLVLAAYNAGERIVDRVGGIPPWPETMSYVRIVREFLADYRLTP